ncbi:hypothetical protein EVAR_78228_1 [Eumeta japonica]|uniref:Uncharacterized protein n=1 Tax=Eumeta variegata TaxID=151549 RepID=A0A4C1T2U7_EUMVA|nr:hypothetical protein EVAR_78228_1 [Eumeta japonica]
MPHPKWTDGETGNYNIIRRNGCELATAQESNRVPPSHSKATPSITESSHTRYGTYRYRVYGPRPAGVRAVTTTPYGVIAVGRIFVSAKVVHENVYGECARRKAHVQGRRCAPIRGIFGDELG